MIWTFTAIAMYEAPAFAIPQYALGFCGGRPLVIYQQEWLLSI